MSRNRNSDDEDYSDEETNQLADKKNLAGIGVTVTKSDDEDEDDYSSDGNDQKNEEDSKKASKKDSKKDSKKVGQKEAKRRSSGDDSENDQPPITESKISEEEYKDRVNDLPESDSEDQTDNLEGTVMLQQSVGREKCKVCDKFVDPKNHLACYNPGCGQVFCTKCLKNCVSSGKPCPACKEYLDLEKLEPSKLYTKMSETTASTVKKLEEKAIKKLTGAVPDENTFKCPEHNKIAELYDIDCQKIVCTMCIGKSGVHKGHDFQMFEERYEEVSTRLGDKITQLDRFVENTSDTLNKLANVAKLKPEEIKNWIATIIKETERGCSNFADDFEERLKEVDKLYKSYNEPVKVTKIKLDELQDLVGSPPHPETLRVMENRDKGYKGEVVKKNELLKSYVEALKDKKKSKTSENSDLIIVSENVKELIDNRKELSKYAKNKLAEILKKRIDELLIEN